MRIGLIGGSGIGALSFAGAAASLDPATPYGPASAPPAVVERGAHTVVFLKRHGEPHRIAPHRVNYRANVHCLHAAGVEAVIAIATVGGIRARFVNGAVVVPHQVIDYTHGRESTFGDASRLLHVDFTEPFTAAWRVRLCTAAARAGVEVVGDGVYGCVQGPRLETAAEIDRMERDGCDVVGMTLMPEAVLARELDLPYASLCLVVNAAAGRGGAHVDFAAMPAIVETGMRHIDRLLDALLDAGAPA
jgi:5'-deoxy-5'-methylthioadenosine phosphorylase